MGFEDGALLVKRGSGAVIGYADKLLVADKAFYLVNALFDLHFINGVTHIHGRETHYFFTAVSALDYKTRNRIISAEQRARLDEVSDLDTVFNQRRAYFFPYVSHVFDLHIPYAVFFVLGISFERGRLALRVETVTEISAAHIRFDVEFLLDIFKKLARRSLFELFRIVYQENKFYVELFK